MTWPVTEFLKLLLAEILLRRRQSQFFCASSSGVQKVLHFPVKAAWGPSWSVLQRNVFQVRMSAFKYCLSGYGPVSPYSFCWKWPCVTCKLSWPEDLLHIGVVIWQLLCTWKAKCAGVMEFPSSSSVLGKTFTKPHEEVLLTQVYTGCAVFGEPVVPGGKGGVGFPNSMWLNSTVPALAIPMFWASFWWNCTL